MLKPKHFSIPSLQIRQQAEKRSTNPASAWDQEEEKKTSPQVIIPSQDVNEADKYNLVRLTYFTAEESDSEVWAWLNKRLSHSG